MESWNFHYTIYINKANKKINVIKLNVMIKENHFSTKKIIGEYMFY